MPSGPELSWALGVAVSSTSLFPPHSTCEPSPSDTLPLVGARGNCCFVICAFYEALSDGAGGNQYCWEEPPEGFEFGAAASAQRLCLDVL